MVDAKKYVTHVAIPFAVTAPNEWRQTGHVTAICAGSQE